MMDREITFDDLLNQIEAEGDLQGKLATQVARLSADMAMEIGRPLALYVKRLLRAGRWLLQRWIS